MFDVFNFGVVYGVLSVVFAIALLTGVICLVVFLIAATKAAFAVARYRRVQTELLLADTSGTVE